MKLRNKTHWICCLPIALLFGCGDKDFVDHSQDPERFAASIKQQIVTSVSDARVSDEPADELWSLVDELDPEALRYRPVGEYESTYQQIYATAKEAYEQADAAEGRPANLGAKLDELESLGDQLPGEVIYDERQR